jgi:hypothetical protein
MEPTRHDNVVIAILGNRTGGVNGKSRESRSWENSFAETYMTGQAAGSSSIATAGVAIDKQGAQSQ